MSRRQFHREQLDVTPAHRGDVTGALGLRVVSRAQQLSNDLRIGLPVEAEPFDGACTGRGAW